MTKNNLLTHFFYLFFYLLSGLILYPTFSWADNLEKNKEINKNIGIEQSNRSLSSVDDLPSQINIGFIPGGDLASTKEAGFKLATYLQKELGISINVVISKNYENFI
jgi:ABC-type phosphate/phosphonate transport system substrate-binding protein